VFVQIPREHKLDILRALEMAHGAEDELFSAGDDLSDDLTVSAPVPVPAHADAASLKHPTVDHWSLDVWVEEAAQRGAGVVTHARPPVGGTIRSAV
jgi:hypothetical protein